MLRDRFENRVIRAVLTCIIITGPAVGYMRTTNRSSFRLISSGMFTVHSNDRVTQLSVIFGHVSKVFHVDYFPRLVKFDVT